MPSYAIITNSSFWADKILARRKAACVLSEDVRRWWTDRNVDDIELWSSLESAEEIVSRLKYRNPRVVPYSHAVIAISRQSDFFKKLERWSEYSYRTGD